LIGALGNWVSFGAAIVLEVLSITNALGQLKRVDEPDASNEFGAIGDPNQYTVYGDDVLNNLLTVSQGVQTRTFVYNALSRLKSAANPESGTILYAYSLGRLIRVSQPEQEPNANLALSDPYNTSGQWSAAFKYNALGDLVRATDANGVSIINEYDKAKRVTKRCYSKPNLNVTATTCAGLGADASENTPEVTFLYDGLLETNQAPASPNYAKGKLTRVSSSVSDTRYTQFDSLGRLTESIQRTPFGTESVENAIPRVSKYAYNFAGALIEQTYPSGRVVRNAYEADGDLAAIASKSATQLGFKTFASNFTYTAWGVIDKLQIGSGRWEVAKFNERHQVTEMSLGTSPTDTSIWKINYDYGETDSNGNVDLNKNTGSVARQTVSFAGLTQPFVQRYRYDPLYRITEALETQAAQQTWKRTWEYDRFGNRTQFASFTGTTQLVNDNQSFPQIDPASNRFNPNQGYQYDKNGNLTANADGLSVVFNGENKQAEVLDQNSQPIGRYFYDGEGRRVKKVTNLETTVFVYDASSKLIAEYSNQTPQNPNTSYVATDTLLSVRLVTDKNGNVVSRRDFKPFGEDLAADGSARKTADKYSNTTEDKVRQRFTGYLKDIETGLDFAEARMYENRHGRFTAVDPLLASGKSANPQTFNRYTYVMNSPLVNTDPTGLQTNSTPPWRDCPKEPCDGTKWTNRDTGDSFIVPDSIFEDDRISMPETKIENTFNLRTPEPEPNPIIAPFLKSLSDAAVDKIYGMGKGTFNFAAGVWNTAASGPVGPLLGVESPFSVGYYQYSNAREAGWSFTTQASLTISTAAFGPSAVPRGGSSIFGLSSESSVASFGGLTPATNEAIISRAATVGAERVVAPNARIAGSLSHSRAARFIDKYQGMFGDRGLRTNYYVRGPNGRLGSSTFDVLDTTKNVIYDFKFGKPVMSNAQFTKYSVARPGAQIKLVDRFGTIFDR